MIEQLLTPQQARARDAMLQLLAAEHAPARLWQRDASLWYPAPDTQARIRQRLGWLDLPTDADVAAQVETVERTLAKRGAQQIVYVVPGVLGRAVRLWLSLVAPRRDLPITVLDAAEPKAVEHVLALRDQEPALVIHAGPFDTPQAWALAAALPADLHVPLPADVGERFGALTAAALLPAALCGLDWRGVLHHVREVDAVWRALEEEVNLPFQLGAALGTFAQADRDLLYLVAPPAQAPLVRWLQAFVGGALGKHRRGFVPFVDTLPNVRTSHHSIVVRLAAGGVDPLDEELHADLQRAGVPIVRCPINDAADAAAFVWIWQLAVAVAAMVIGLNPFDAPDADVINTRIMEQMGHAPVVPPVLPPDWQRTLHQARFVVLTAYLPDQHTPQLEQIRASLVGSLGKPVLLVFPMRDWLFSLQLLHAGRPGGAVWALSVEDPLRHDPRAAPLRALQRAQVAVEWETWQRMGRPAAHTPSTGDVANVAGMVLEHGI